MTATFWVLNVEMFSCNSSPQNFPTFSKHLHFFSFPFFRFSKIEKHPKTLNKNNY